MISLITPNYNGEKWLDDCLSSVADQSSGQDQIEMILMDDGSTDESRSIVERYRNEIPGLKTTWHEHTGTPAKLLNKAINQAIGKYVLFLDSDDFLGKESIERLDDFTNEHPSDVVAFELKGLNRKVPTSMFSETIADASIVKSGIYKTLGVWKMCDREFLMEKSIQFDTSLRRGYDVLFYTEAMLKARSVSILAGYPFYTLRGREDGSSATQVEWNHTERLNVARRVGETAVSLAKDDITKHHFLIRLFNADALEIMSSPNASAETLLQLRRELSPYWSNEVASLIYTNEARKRLIDFFGAPKNE